MEFIVISNQLSEEFELYEGCEIIIYNGIGMRVMSAGKFQINSLQPIHISHLPPGAYIIQIGKETAIFVKI